MVTGQKVINSTDQGLLPTIAWQLSGQDPVFALDGGVFSAGAAVNWAKSIGLFSEFDEINRFNSLAAIESGLMFVPALTGLGCPYWDSNARGIWMGLSLDHSAKHVV